MKLIIATPSPFARKVRIVLREKGIPCDEVIDTPWNADSFASDYSPLAKIPILIADDGTKFFDSRVIVEYIESMPNSVQLLPKKDSDYIQARQIEALADGISDSVVLTVLENHRPAPLQSKNWISRQNSKIQNGISFLNTQLNGIDWFVGNGMTIGDISVACALAYLDLRLPNLSWRQLYPRLAHFSEVMERRESFRATRLKSQKIDAVV